MITQLHRCRVEKVAGTRCHTGTVNNGAVWACFGVFVDAYVVLINYDRQKVERMISTKQYDMKLLMYA